MLSAITKAWAEVAVILVVIVSNTIIGFRQEYRSERTMEALTKMASPTARVLRDTDVSTISARLVAVGDVVSFEEGDTLPADIRILECFHLEIDESALTGASVPARKSAHTLHLDAGANEIPLADRQNMAYSSTIVTRGRGKGIVVYTGISTEIGKIAKELSSANSSSEQSQKTPLQRGMLQLAIGSAVLVVVLIIVVFAVNRFDITDSVLSYAIGLAVAVIPEGLLAVTTITMAYGVRKMAKQRAIVRRLLALESIGSVTVICSDKTGTLTQGKMFVSSVWVPDMRILSVSGHGYVPLGQISEQGVPNKVYTASNMPPPLLRLAQCASLCNMAILKRKGRTVEDEQRRYSRVG